MCLLSTAGQVLKGRAGKNKRTGIWHRGKYASNGYWKKKEEESS